MPRFNIIYLLLILGMVFFLPVTKFITSHPQDFFGIAENQIRSINLEYPVIVKEMKVVVGQKVEEGQLLAKFHRTDLPIKMNDINYELKELSAKKGIGRLGTDSDVEKLKAQRELLIIEYNNRINLLQNQFAAQQKVLEGLKTIEVTEIKNPAEAKINALKSEMDKELGAIDLQIESRKKGMTADAGLVDVRIKKLRGELDLIKEQEDALNLYAPFSGIIGTLNYLTGENVDSYASIMKIYGERPNVVTTYIGDGQLAEIAMGDTLDVFSMNQSEYQLEGVVVGLGTRITTLPERLRKLPTMKSWGREVQLQIPATNNFMQGEKVRVNMERLAAPSTSFFD